MLLFIINYLLYVVLYLVWNLDYLSLDRNKIIDSELSFYSENTEHRIQQ